MNMMLVVQQAQRFGAMAAAEYGLICSNSIQLLSAFAPTLHLLRKTC
jgi:hypothetical protein